MAKERGWRLWAVLRRFQMPLLVLALILVAARLALPFAIRDYVNRQLRAVPEYGGEVGAVRVNLWRGAYQIYNLRIVKTTGAVPVPFVSIPHMDLSIEWPQLLRGVLVGEIAMTRPALNFVNGPTEETKQTGIDKGWKHTLEALFPFTINRFEIRNGVIRYADPHQQWPVDIYLTNLFAVATNLTNVRDYETELPAGLVARGRTLGQGEVAMELLMNPMAETPTFKLAASVTHMELTALNDFLRAYSNTDAESGRFWIYLHIAAAEGRYRGYVKPFFLDVNLVELEEMGQQNILQSFWESLVGGVAELFENQPSEQVATQVPLAGQFDRGTQIDLWTTIGGILRNAFLEALRPGIRQPVRLPDEDRNDPGNQESPADAGNDLPKRGGKSRPSSRAE